ncbi:hypothetical protein [Amycolatopsis sp. Hca4]|uniref:hypothetical protein n=1 Tax=Amycolatopsis sp. Hca4 TaxID=2742131 RepID=UPI0015923E30|nr:hypothetical protein [Amycolatopsis sp. Hca4]QKV74009.1 hypothetical protein HUT10_09670 [Amycolatopsis sp. Hca4]
MADQFRLDPAAAREVVAKLGAAGADFADAVAKLEHVLDRYDGCWGEDKAGKKFAEGYVENAQKIRQGLHDLPGNVRELGDGITSTVTGFQDLDEANAKQYDHQLADAVHQQESQK